MNNGFAKKEMPTVVIFGRTNVGKSTLFNRLTEKNQALISNVEGTTRDSNLGEVSWLGKNFSLIDTGGFMDLNFLLKKKAEASTIDEKVQKQARSLLVKADLILFVVDNNTGLLPQDKKMAMILKKIIDKDKEILLVVNKVDNFKKTGVSPDFYSLNFKEFIGVSAVNGSGTGDLLDLIIKKIKAKGLFTDGENNKITEVEEIKKDKKDILKVCILGKPNVGKSSLLNSILGYERVIVSPQPHTTREPQDTYVTYKDKEIKIVDTAGITKKYFKEGALVKQGILKTLETVRKSDVVLLVIDISEEITKQDSKLVEEIFDNNKSLIFIANKWDKIEEKDTKKYTTSVYREIPFAQFAPVQFISAKNNLKVNKIIDLVLKIAEERKTVVGENALDDFIKKCIKLHKPTKGRGTRYPRIYKFKQIKANPPKFLVKIGAKEDLADSYTRFLANRLREKFGFFGTPISIGVEKAKTQEK